MAEREANPQCERCGGAGEVRTYMTGFRIACPECRGEVDGRDGTGGVYECPVCGEEFDNQQSAEHHFGSHIPVEYINETWIIEDNE